MVALSAILLHLNQSEGQENKEKMITFSNWPCCNQSVGHSLSLPPLYNINRKVVTIIFHRAKKENANLNKNEEQLGDFSKYISQ